MGDILPLLDAFTKSQKATIFFFVRASVCPPARIEQPGSHWTDFHEI
jgi:hypothetical protein